LVLFVLKKLIARQLDLGKWPLKKNFENKDMAQVFLNSQKNLQLRITTRKLLLLARLSAIDFYKKNFFKTSGSIFIDVTVKLNKNV
jgi:hypothetical protein